MLKTSGSTDLNLTRISSVTAKQISSANPQTCTDTLNILISAAAANGTLNITVQTGVVDYYCYNTDSSGKSVATVMK